MASNKNERTTPSILDGVFYNIVSNANGKIIAECVNCINRKKISGTLTSTSNFLRHVKVNNLRMTNF